MEKETKLFTFSYQVDNVKEFSDTVEKQIKEIIENYNCGFISIFELTAQLKDVIDYYYKCIKDNTHKDDLESVCKAVQYLIVKGL